MHLAPGKIWIFFDHDGVKQIIGDFVPNPGELYFNRW